MSISLRSTLLIVSVYFAHYMPGVSFYLYTTCLGKVNKFPGAR